MAYSQQTFRDLPSLRAETGVPYRGQASDLPITAHSYTCEGEATATAKHMGDTRTSCGRQARALISHDNRTLGPIPDVFPRRGKRAR